VMGARYARAALAVEPSKLPNAARLVLVAMALRVLDKPSGATPAGTYFGGRHRLLGDLAQMPTRTTLRTLARHVQTLEQLGLIVRESKPAPGKRAVYILRLPVDNSRS